MYWNTTHKISQIINFRPGYIASICGRVTSFRRQGGIAFGHIQDETGKLQFCFQKRLLGEDLFKSWVNQIKIGVHVGLYGSTWQSSTGESTLLVGVQVENNTGNPLEPFEDSWPQEEDHWEEVNNFIPSSEGTPFGQRSFHPKAGVKYSFKLLQDSWRGFPDKFHGIVGEEARLRLRFLDCAVNPDTRQLFIGRFGILSGIRTFLEENEFLEIETPVLAAQASGAMAKPFITHHNALDSDLFLRIAPETYLKRAVGAGLGKVFEIGKQFRNEGIDPSHLQEFTTVEWYWPNANYMDNLQLFRSFLRYFSCTRRHNIPEEWKTKMWDWASAPIKTYRELFQAYANASPDNMTCQEADETFKKLVRPNLKEPVFVIDYPAHLSPMAQRKPQDDNTVEQWQFIVEGWELVKCYTEITNPVLQRKLLEEQALAKVNGDEEAMDLEEDFLECMEYGMLPMSGLGIGIDRLICLLSGNTSLKDVLLFPPLLKANK